MKKKNSKKSLLIISIALVALIAVTGIVQIGKAQVEKSKVAELTELAATLNNADAFIAGLDYLSGQISGMFGSGTRYPNGLSADTTSPIAGEVRGITFTSTGAVVFSGSLTSGGGEYATTSRDATHTLTSADLSAYSYIYVMNEEAAISDLTWTLPATSTMIAFLPEIGNTRTWTFENATTTGDVDSKLIFVTGDGMDFVTSSSTDSLTLNAGDYADLECKRIHYNESTDEEILCSIERYVDVD